MKAKPKVRELTGYLKELQDAVGEKLRVELPDRLLFRYDALLQGDVPLAVVMAETTEDVARTLKICDKHDLPVIPRGGASGLSGGVVPIKPSVVISTTRMKGLQIDQEGMTATVQIVTHFDPWFTLRSATSQKSNVSMNTPPPLNTWWPATPL